MSGPLAKSPSPLALAGAYAVASPTYKATILADSPLAYLRLGESSGDTAADASGNGYTGTYVPNSGGSWTGGTLGVTGAIVGDSDTAADFSSGNSGVDFPGLKLGGRSAVSIEAWVQYISCSTNQVIAGCYWSNAIVLTGGASNVLEWFVQTDGGSVTVSSPLAYNDGSWHHIVGTWSAADGNSRLFVDGSQVAVAALSGTATLGTDNFSIGDLMNPTGFCWRGGIDEVAAYGSRLSATRILAHYNAGI